MRESALSFINNVIGVGINVLVFLLPIFALTGTTSRLVYPKFVLLVSLSLGLVFLWGVKSFLHRKLILRQTVFDLAFLLLLLSFLVSAWFSISTTGSLIGAWGVWHWSLFSLLSLLGFYYLLVNNLLKPEQIQRVLISLLVSGGVVAIAVIVGYIVNFAPLTKAVRLTNFLAPLNYNLVGGGRALIIFLAALLPFALQGLQRSYLVKNWPRVVLYVLQSVSLSLALILWLSPFLPGLGTRVKLGPSLGLRDSWVVSLSALRDHPLVGSGPGTFLQDFTQYRPLALNRGDNWGLRFSKPGSEYFNIVATLGILGIVAWVLLVMRILRLIARSRTKVISGVYPLAALIILLGWLFTSASLVLSFLLVLILALWMVDEKIHETGEVREKAFGFIAARVFAVLAALLLVGGGFVLIQDLRSHVAFAHSLNLIVQNAPGRDVYEAQQQAIRLNPYRDVYHRAYAQTNLALARAVLVDRGDKLTSQEKEDVAALAQQAIRESLLITERLSPFDARNWEARGQVYESLIGLVGGAENWAISAYQRAIQLDPTNPGLRLVLGGVYLKGKEFDLAEQSFRQAVQLKPDFANAHFNLAVAYRENGKYQLAQDEFNFTQRLLDVQKGSELDKQRLQGEMDKLEDKLSKVTPTPTP